MDLKEAIMSRKSSREFSNKKPELKKILYALDYARFAPSAGNLQIIKFIIVSDPTRINQLAQACQQDFVSSVHYVVVAVSDDKQLKRLFPERAERYARQQAGLALQNFLLGLTEQGFVTTWVGHFNDPQVKRILDIPDDKFVEAIFPIGKPKTKQHSKRRFKTELNNLIYFDKWGKSSIKEPLRIKQEHL